MHPSISSLDAPVTAVVAPSPRRQAAAHVQAHYDVVVIGAGLAGLAASLDLARNGARVLLVEKNAQPGGYAVNFKRGPFRIDGALQVVDGASPGGSFHAVLSKLGMDGTVEPVPVGPYLHEIDLRTGAHRRFDLDWDRLTALLSRSYPSETRAIERFLRMAAGMGEFLKGWSDASRLGKAWLSMKHWKQVPACVRYLNKSARQLLDGFFTSQPLKDDLARLARFTGTSLDDMSAVVFLAAGFERFTTGSHYVRGGSGALTRALARAVRQAGGTVLLNHEVTGLGFAGGRVTSVTVRDAARNRAPREIETSACIHAADPRLLVETLLPLDALPAAYTARIQGRKATESMLAVYLGLDVDIKTLGFGDYAYEFTLPSGRSLHAFAYSNVDPSCCPAGTTSLTVLTFTSIDRFETAIALDKGVRGARYRALKAACIEEVIDGLREAFGFDVKASMVMADAATPVTFKRYTGNHRGSFAGFAATVENCISDPIGSKTPVSNLFVAGQWTNTGGGFTLSLRGGLACAGQVLRWLGRNRNSRSRRRVLDEPALDQARDEGRARLVQVQEVAMQ